MDKNIINVTDGKVLASARLRAVGLRVARGFTAAL